jgi:hypothetical protein
METLLQIFFNINKYVLNPIIALGFAVAMVVLLWGGLMMIIAQQNGDMPGAQRYRRHLMWGLLGMFIMASVYGIMEIVTNSIRFVGGA